MEPLQTKNIQIANIALVVVQHKYFLKKVCHFSQVSGKILYRRDQVDNFITDYKVWTQLIISSRKYKRAMQIKKTANDITDDSVKNLGQPSLVINAFAT